MGKASRKKTAPREVDGPFLTDEMRRWMGNYTPVIANEMCRSRSAQELRMTSLAKREEQAKQGTGWGSGAIPGISVKADARLGSLPKRFLITKK